MLREGAFWLSASVLVIATSCLVLATSRDIIVLGSVAGVTWVQWSLLKHVSDKPIPLVGIVVGVINVVGVCGWVYYPQIAVNAAVSARIESTPQIYGAAARAFATASLAVTVGGLIGYAMMRNRTAQRPASTHMSLIWRTFPVRPLILPAMVPLTVLTCVYSPAGLLEREHYSNTVLGGSWPKLSSLILPFGIALSALLFQRSVGIAKVWSGLLYAAYGIAVFATGSRALVVLPAMLMISWILVSGPDQPKTRKRIYSLLTVWLTIEALSLPVSMRGNSLSGAGLIPYWETIVDSPSLLWQVDLPSVLGNLLFAVPLAGASSLLPDKPVGWLLTSLSPLPGGMTDWEEISPMMRINVYTPTSGIGELAGWGLGTLFLVMMVEGLLISVIHSWIDRMAGGALAALLPVGGAALSAIIAINLLQYNLRTSTRFLWYFLLVVLLARVFCSRGSDAAGGRGEGAALAHSDGPAPTGPAASGVRGL